MKNACMIMVFYLFSTSTILGNSTDPFSVYTAEKCTDNLNKFCLYGYINSYVDIDLLFEDWGLLQPEEAFDYDKQDFHASLKEKTKEIKMQKDHLSKVMEQKRTLYKLYDTTVFGKLTNPTIIDRNYHSMHFQRFEGMGIQLRL